VSRDGALIVKASASVQADWLKSAVPYAALLVLYSVRIGNKARRRSREGQRKHLLLLFSHDYLCVPSRHCSGYPQSYPALIIPIDHRNSQYERFLRYISRKYLYWLSVLMSVSVSVDFPYNTGQKL